MNLRCPTDSAYCPVSGSRTERLPNGDHVLDTLDRGLADTLHGHPRRGFLHRDLDDPEIPQQVWPVDWARRLLDTFRAFDVRPHDLDSIVRALHAHPTWAVRCVRPPGTVPEIAGFTMDPQFLLPAGPSALTILRGERMLIKSFDQYIGFEFNL